MRVATRPGTSASPDTLPWLTSQASSSFVRIPRVLGTDGLASRKGERCGTILVGLEYRHVVDLLLNRHAEMFVHGIDEHRRVEVIGCGWVGTYVHGEHLILAKWLLASTYWRT